MWCHSVQTNPSQLSPMDSLVNLTGVVVLLEGWWISDSQGSISLSSRVRGHPSPSVCLDSHPYRTATAWTTWHPLFELVSSSRGGLHLQANRPLVIGLKTQCHGLWSVSSGTGLPTMYSGNFSHVHIIARASFSICEYLCSVLLMARDAYATGFQSEGVNCCRRTTPSP